MNRLKQAVSKLPPWLLTILVSGAILWLTLAPQPLPDYRFPLFQGVDKMVHALMFGGLTFSMLIDASRYHGWHRLGGGMICLLTAITALAGVGIEFLQPVSGRAFEPADMVADAAGCAIFALLWLLIQKRSL